MRLTRLSISNFRSIADTVKIDVPAQHLVLAGSNNAGKSNLLTALDWVLGNRTPYNLRAARSDFFDPTLAIVIEAELGDITATDRGYLMGVASSKPQRGALSKKTDPTITLTLTIPPAEAKGSDEEDSEEEAARPSDRAELIVNLWGFPIHQKSTDRRRQVAQSVLVASERSVDDDLQASRWTPYGQLMKAVLESSPDYDELQELLASVNEKIQEIFASERAALLSQARVVSYVDDLDFQLTKDNNPAELLRYLEILVTENGRKSNLDELGSGTQNAIIIGMLELVLKSKDSKVKVFAVEEPDAFLHPHGVRYLASLVQSIGLDQGLQVVLTTHSVNLLAGLQPRDIVRVEKRAGKTIAYQSPGTLSDPDFARFINADTAEMFFAQKVLLVEGDTERFLLPPLSSMLSQNGKTLDFNQQQISVVVMDGKDNIVNFLKILDEFEIGSRAILDADFLAGSSCKSLVSYLRAKGKTIDDSSAAQLTKDLWSEGILVLAKGEIEDYVPEADVAVLTGKPVADVQSAKAAAGGKTSDAFKKLFKAGKPVYGRKISDHYLAQGSVPADIKKLINLVSK